MTQILTVTSSVEYEALRLTDEGAKEAVLVWLTPIVEDMSEISFDVFDGQDIYALKHPSGNVAFVEGISFAKDFDIQNVSEI